MRAVIWTGGIISLREGEHVDEIFYGKDTNEKFYGGALVMAGLQRFSW